MLRDGIETFHPNEAGREQRQVNVRPPCNLASGEKGFVVFRNRISMQKIADLLVK
jgi:hypothetical protein